MLGSDCGTGSELASVGDGAAVASGWSVGWGKIASSGLGSVAGGVLVGVESSNGCVSSVGGVLVVSSGVVESVESVEGVACPVRDEDSNRVEVAASRMAAGSAAGSVSRSKDGSETAVCSSMSGGSSSGHS